MDSVQEFAVVTSRIKAEYARAGGGAISIITKSGTNEFHGSGFWFFRDKSFFFVTYERVNETSNSTLGVAPAVEAAFSPSPRRPRWLGKHRPAVHAKLLHREIHPAVQRVESNGRSLRL